MQIHKVVWKGRGREGVGKKDRERGIKISVVLTLGGGKVGEGSKKNRKRTGGEKR